MLWFPLVLVCVLVFVGSGSESEPQSKVSKGQSQPLVADLRLGIS